MRTLLWFTTNFTISLLLFYGHLEGFQWMVNLVIFLVLLNFFVMVALLIIAYGDISEYVLIKGRPVNKVLMISYNIFFALSLAAFGFIGLALLDAVASIIQEGFYEKINKTKEATE